MLILVYIRIIKCHGWPKGAKKGRKHLWNYVKICGVIYQVQWNYSFRIDVELLLSTMFFDELSTKRVGWYDNVEIYIFSLIWFPTFDMIVFDSIYLCYIVFYFSFLLHENLFFLKVSHNKSFCILFSLIFLLLSFLMNFWLT